MSCSVVTSHTLWKGFTKSRWNIILFLIIQGDNIIVLLFFSSASHTPLIPLGLKETKKVDFSVAFKVIRKFHFHGL